LTALRSRALLVKERSFFLCFGQAQLILSLLWAGATALGGTALGALAPCTLHPGPCTLDPVPCILHPEPCTLNPAPATLHPRPCNLNPAPSTPDRKWAGAVVAKLGPSDFTQASE